MSSSGGVRNASGAAGGDLAGNYPNPTVNSAANLPAGALVQWNNDSVIQRLGVGSLTTPGSWRVGANLLHTGANLGFFNTGPVARPAAYTLTYPTNTRVLAADAVVDPAATAATSVTPFGYTTAAQADAIRAAVIELHAELNTVRGVLRQLVADMQSYGLAQ
jgi:hypothetical protein